MYTSNILTAGLHFIKGILAMPKYTIISYKYYLCLGYVYTVWVYSAQKSEKYLCLHERF